MKTSELIIGIMSHFDEKTNELPQELQVEPVQEQLAPVVQVKSPEEQRSSVDLPVEEQPSVLETKVPDIVEQAETIPQEPDEPVASRTRQSSLRQGKYSMATKVDKRRVNDPTKQKAIENAEDDEVELILEGLKAVQIISKEEIIFTVDKYLANGDFDKCKSRIVLHGNEQDPHLYSNKSSPTVAIHSILLV